MCAATRTRGPRSGSLARRARSPARGEAVPGARHDVVDALEVGGRRHRVHALLEADVTRPRQLAASAGERPPEVDVVTLDEEGREW